MSGSNELEPTGRRRFLGGSVMAAGGVALAEARVGQGRVVLFGFRPQHRAQTHETFKLLFNALYPWPWPNAAEAAMPPPGTAPDLPPKLPPAHVPSVGSSGPLLAGGTRAADAPERRDPAPSQPLGHDE